MLLALLVAGCSGGDRAGSVSSFLEMMAQRPLDGSLRSRIAAASRPHVILISLDTLRADHLGSYGYPVDTSPFLDELAAAGVRFESVLSQAPKTAPSHMSLFTGVYPSVHGAHLDYADGTPSYIPVRSGLGTLPEWLHELGYRTGAWTGGGQVHAKIGFARGFDEFLVVLGELSRGRMRGIRGWFREKADRPCFLFIHTYQIHDPYIPPEPYNSMFSDGYDGWIVGDRDRLREIAGGRDFDALHDVFWRAEGDRIDTSLFGPEDVRRLVSLYDGGIRYTDEVLRDFFDQLARDGLLANTLIVVTSDHGEEFLEHGEFLHKKLYRETLEVPLIVYHPTLARGGRVIPQRVRLFDLTPTLLELVGGRVPDQMQAESLLPLLAGQDSEPRTVFSEEPWANEVYHRSLRAPNYTAYDKGGRIELYASADDAERNDLAAGHGDLVAAMDRMMLELVREGELLAPGDEAEAQQPTEEEIKTLRALGYVQ